MSLFYNTVTTNVINYAQLKALFPVGFSWPVADNGVSVDARLLMDNIHPDILQWKRLFEVAEPTPENIWQIVDPYTVVYNSGSSHYEQDWNVRARSPEEMEEINAQVQSFLEELKYLKLIEAIEYNGIYADALPDTQGTLSRVFSSILTNTAIEEIAWEGSAGTNQINRWEIATTDDLQELINLCFLKEQKTFYAKRFVMLQQLTSSYDTWEDIETAFNTQMEA